jgi:hypothetical protein
MVMAPQGSRRELGPVAWAVRILVVVLGLIGLTLAAGGAWLAALGGSPYYAVAHQRRPGRGLPERWGRRRLHHRRAGRAAGKPAGRTLQKFHLRARRIKAALAV